jgi:uncharacterized membrane-anchored protein
MLKSKTVWFSLATMAAGFADSLVQVLPPGKALMVVGAISLALRAVTTQPLSEK